MLFDLNGNKMTRIPHEREFNTWRSRLSDADYDKAVDAIHEQIDGERIFISSFLPGSNWMGTPFEPLYFACGQSEEQSGYFFGLIVWAVIMDDDDDWVFKPAEKDSGDPLGTTYWRKNG